MYIYIVNEPTKKGFNNSTKVLHWLPIIKKQIRNETLIAFTIGMLTITLISAFSVSFTLGYIYKYKHLYMAIEF